jgi:GH18 family chitinase
MEFIYIYTYILITKIYIFIDWEFPGNIERGADKYSKIHFNLLVSEFRDFIDNEDVSGKKKLILSSAVAADPRVIEKAYDIINLCKNLDYVNKK